MPEDPDEKNRLLQQARAARAEAERARRLARILVPPTVTANLDTYASELEAEADALEQRAAADRESNQEPPPSN